jgi:hypothetical protein
MDSRVDRANRHSVEILHQGVRCEKRGPAVSEEAKNVRARKTIRELRVSAIVRK